ncbi:tyrosine-protein phosphatase non-receptor type substrate 1-like [Apostichopus japonicus]|uniref:tyrosine-protein phosphatase non-receptor type substrate 1-like n=1 Tax=Stichopus japonicus TaxID=307972 RepID=UPI003AB88E2E
MNLNCFSFILAICLSSICVQPALANWPVFSIEKGGTAVVQCVPKGDETAYFWSKGEDFATSQSVASRVTGLPSPDSEKYLVNEEGSLVIYNVTLADEGIYHCRIVSENTNCRGAVSINVKVNDFSFGIEQCEPNKCCSLQVEPSKETNLTCTAKGGPSSLSLKWFNGSKEITPVYSEHSLNEESITVSETIKVPNEFGLLLTCKAIASEDGQACARLAHVRLEKNRYS